MTVNVSVPASVTVSTTGVQGIPGTPGSPGSPGSPGTDGTDGTNGTNGHTPQYYGGTGVPVTLHTDGDVVINTIGDVYQQVAGAWTGPIANIRGPAGSGGGGGSIITAEARIMVENIAVPNTGGWAIVSSSGGTPLQCSIAAAVGDRILVAVEMMRTGGGSFLDKAILDSSGAISVYAGSGTGTPLAEGAPVYYPQASVFPGTSGTTQFTVQAGQPAAGIVTIALVYKGAGSGNTTIYASATYPWYMLLTNIGPAPA